MDLLQSIVDQINSLKERLIMEASNKEMDDEEIEEDDTSKHLDVDTESVEIEPKKSKTEEVVLPERVPEKSKFEDFFFRQQFGMPNPQPDRLLAMLNAIGAQNQFLAHSGQTYGLFQNGLNASTSNLGAASPFLPYALNSLNAKCQTNMIATNNNNEQLSSAEKFLLESPLNLSRTG
jgi:hypothetical protein